MNDELKNEMQDLQDLKEIVRSIHGAVVSTREYLETEMMQGFEKVNGKIDALDMQIDGVDKKFEGRFDSLDRKMMQGFEQMDEKVDTVEANLKQHMGEGFEALDEKIDSVQEQIEAIPQRVQGVESRMDRLNEKVLDELYPVKEKNKDLEKRMFALEKLQAA